MPSSTNKRNKDDSFRDPIKHITKRSIPPLPAFDLPADHFVLLFYLLLVLNQPAVALHHLMLVLDGLLLLLQHRTVTLVLELQRLQRVR